MPLPVIYRGGGNPNTLYSFQDIANGTGIITFYGAVDQSGAGILATTTIYSAKIETLANITTANFVKEIDVDFDVVMNVPTTLKGTMTASIPMFPYSGSTAEAYITVKLRKVSGGIETEVANATSVTLAYNATYDGEKMTTVRFDVPITNYKKGDSIRVTLEVYAKAGAGAPYVVIAHDPKGRIGTTGSQKFSAGENTIMTVNIPVRIDL